MQKTCTQEPSPSVVAAIAAAVQMMAGKEYIAVRIERTSLWTIAARMARQGR